MAEEPPDGFADVRFEVNKANLSQKHRLVSNHKPERQFFFTTF